MVRRGAAKTAETIAHAHVVSLDRDADFRAFYMTFYPRLARYCYRLVRDEELARDITQETFASLLARWIAIRDPEAYLFHVATNLVRSTGKRAKRESVALTEKGLAMEAQAEGGRHLALHLAVERLPRRYRDIVLLFYFADLPLAQVAAAVRRPEGTVKRQLAEARALLATDLQDPDACLVS